VQYQVSGKILAKGSKVRRLFFLHFSIPLVIFMACTIVNHKSEIWHKHLGHPNPVFSTHLINSGLLGNKDQFSSHISLECATCKLDKSKSLSFPFLLIVLMLKNVLIWFIVTSGVFLNLYLMRIINTLLHSSTITTNIPRFIFFVLNLRYFLSFNYMLLIELNFLQVLKC